jgi:hypothetical protein
MYFYSLLSIGWIDIHNLMAKVPMIAGSIYVKILKVKSNAHNKLFNVDKLAKVGLLNSGPKAPANNSSQTQPLLQKQFEEPTKPVNIVKTTTQPVKPPVQEVKLQEVKQQVQQKGNQITKPS